MNEEIEYAEMLEIPVSTVNVVKKRGRKSKKTAALKEEVISKVNETAEPPKETAPVEEKAPAPAVEAAATEAALPVQIPLQETESILGRYKDFAYANENDRQRIPARRERIILGVEFAAACALCFGIFLTNVFMPESAINTFFRSLTDTNEQAADTRTYADFTLSPIVLNEDAVISVSETGVLSFTTNGCVYPAANGEVSEIAQETDGSFTVKIAHSPTFSEVVSGLDYVAYEIGDSVRANVPLGVSDGEGEVQVTLYESGQLLNCFSLSEEGAPVWNPVEQQ
ncbi:MAG: hypothetical protein IJX81_06270 [Clostridia bacterium]|nr:hypothetical protein [Clostridia bacterium]